MVQTMGLERESQEAEAANAQLGKPYDSINPNQPKSFKILCMLLYDFGGFRLVECSYMYHVFTWGLMSQFCLSTKNVPFGYCTV